MKSPHHFSCILAVSISTCLSIPFASASEVWVNQTRSPVETSSYLSDALITARLKAELLAKKLSGISVATEFGVVTLAGETQSDRQRRMAIQIASGISGVRSIEITELVARKPNA